MNNGFGGVHARIDTFKDEFNNHRLICKDLFAEIKKDEALRKGAENGRDRELRSRIDWGKVKTGAAIAVAGLLSVAAIKILIMNADKFTRG